VCSSDLYYSGLMKVLDEYSGLSVAARVMEQNIVFGDASLQVRTKSPEVFSVTLPTLADESASHLAVEIGEISYGTIAITSNGELIGTAVFDQAGIIQVPVEGKFFELKTVEVTVTGPNMVPYEATVAITLSTSDVFELATPAHPLLQGNFPNPFNPVTQIVFELPTEQHITLTVFDVRGNVVKRLTNGTIGAGRHEVRWNGDTDGGQKAPSGLYLYRLTSLGSTQTGRMVLAK